MTFPSHNNKITNKISDNQNLANFFSILLALLHFETSFWPVAIIAEAINTEVQYFYVTFTTKVWQLFISVISHCSNVTIIVDFPEDIDYSET